MEIIVRNKTSGLYALLVSGGYGFSKTEGTFFGALEGANPKYEGRVPAILMTNNNGELIWDTSDNYEVATIDGKKPKEYFKSVIARIPKTATPKDPKTDTTK